MRVKMKISYMALLKSQTIVELFLNSFIATMKPKCASPIQECDNEQSSISFNLEEQQDQQEPLRAAQEISLFKQVDHRMINRCLLEIQKAASEEQPAVCVSPFKRVRSMAKIQEIQPIKVSKFLIPDDPRPKIEKKLQFYSS
jgi:hypothetical protein